MSQTPLNGFAVANRTAYQTAAETITLPGVPALTWIEKASATTQGSAWTAVSGTMAQAIAAGGGDTAFTNATLAALGAPSLDPGIAVGGPVGSENQPITEVVTDSFSTSVPAGTSFLLWDPGASSGGDNGPFTFAFQAHDGNSVVQASALSFSIADPFSTPSNSVITVNALGVVSVVSYDNVTAPDNVVIVTTDAPITELQVTAKTIAADFWGLALAQPSGNATIAPTPVTPAAVTTPYTAPTTTAPTVTSPAITTPTVTTPTVTTPTATVPTDTTPTVTTPTVTTPTVTTPTVTSPAVTAPATTTPTSPPTTDGTTTPGPQVTVPALGTGTGTATPCFLAGTAIATPRGPMPVDHLRQGDLVLARFAGAARIVWIGRRRIDLARHPGAGWPIRFARDAVAAGVPCRDLLLSPDHAVFLGGVLIPAKYLVNGISVREDRRFARVTYLHIELARHDVLLAEALPAESYLDTGNRAQFDDAAGSCGRIRTWERDACAPLWGEGGPAEHVRAAIAQRAALRWHLGKASALHRADACG